MNPNTNVSVAEAGKLAMCFAPATAAIIGASTDPLKFGGRALKFCLERGYAGRLYPVNAKNDIVQGVQAYRSVADLPEAPDVAVIAVPAPLVRENLIAAGERGAKVAIVYGAQFAEAGVEGREKQDELLAIARDHGMRMIGPNCMGVISLASGFVASFTSAPEHNDGNGWPDVGTVSVASQSGAVGIQIFAQLRDRGLGLANWISTGNQADIDVADAIAYYASDPETRTIAVYMEDASRGEKLLNALELARQARKPVAILKVGTTPEGGRAAAGHTASMYVEDRLVEDLFAQYGVLRAGSVNELIDLAAACDAGVVPSSPEIAAVSVSGGGAVMISDTAAKNGLSLPAYPIDALAELKTTNSFVNDSNPIDISAPSMSNMAITGGHLKWGLERDEPTMLGYISHVPLVPRTRPAILSQLVTFREAHPDKLIAIAGNFHADDRKALVKTGVAVFDDPTVATRSVAKLARAGAAFERAPQTLSGRGPDHLDTGAVDALLAEAGITRTPEVAVMSAQSAREALVTYGEIVMKLVAPTLAHKTEIGGVVTGLASGEAVGSAYDTLSEIAKRVSAEHPDTALVAAPMLRGVEVLLGVRNDEHFGALITLGSGGTLCELFDDLTYMKPPVTPELAADAIRRIRVAPMLGGWRGAPAVDEAALVQAIVRLSEIADKLPSLEINPLFVTAEQGVVAADLLVHSEQGPRHG